MSEVIQTWLTNRLGVIVDVESECFLHMVQNGYLIAKLLYNSDLISEEQMKFVEDASDFKVAFNHVATWLRNMADLIVEDKTRDAIFSGKHFAAINLLHKLYLTFKDKDRLYFNTKKMQVEPTTRFTLEPVLEIPSNAELGKPLENYKHVINWYKVRHAKLMNRCKKAMEHYVMDNHFDQFEHTLGLVGRPNSKLAVGTIRKGKKQISIEIQTVLLEQLWKNVLGKVKHMVDSTVSGKLLKQACFEKRIATRLNEVRKQKDAMVTKRSMVDDEVKQMIHNLTLEDAFFKTKEVHDEKQRYHFERERTTCLQNKLHEEMVRLDVKRKHEVCWSIIEDIIDFAVYESEYLRHFGQVLNHPSDGVRQRLKSEMVALFNARQPIFGLGEDPLVLMLEGEAQNAINQQYFFNYQEYKCPWELHRHAPNFLQHQDAMRLGSNILGHIVYRLLLAKYPKLPPAPPPILPKVTTAVCVNRIDDSIVPTILGKLLAERGVKVVQLEDAINTCLLAYKPEMRLETPQIPEDDVENISIVQFQEKQVQTPEVFPGVSPQLNPKAELGRMVYETLSLGEALDDQLLAKIFVEYLKDLKEVNGWVLVNYPQDFEQATILEETLTSIARKPKPKETYELRKKCRCTTNHIEDFVELEFRGKPNRFDDGNAALRVSKLVVQPDIPQAEVDHGTYLTGYVRTERIQDGACCESDLDTFYRDQGVLYVFYYKAYDLPTIKHLAKLIVQDHSLPPKTSLEIFGDSLLYLKGDLGYSGKVNAASDKKVVVQIAPKKGKVEDKETQIPEVQFVIGATPKPDVRPNVAQWDYVDVAIPPMLQVALASLWEGVEHVYVGEMEQLFFRLRMFWGGFVPYLSSVKTYMSDFIKRPDDEIQVHLHQFQVMYNEIDADARCDDEFKAELHHRVHDFKQKLWGLCDQRMREAEDERRKIIGHHWVTRQLGEVVDAYIALLKLEIDRCADTMQLLNDYYTGMIIKMPSDEPVFKKTSVTHLDKHLKVEAPYIKQLLTHGVIETSSNPFQKALNDNFNACMAAAESYQKKSLDCLAKMERYLQPKSPARQKPKGKLPKCTGPEEDVKVVAPQLIDEWKSALAGETLRTKCRLNVVKSSATLEVVQGVIPHAGLVFGGVKDVILARYKWELSNVQSACDVFSRAIEEETSLQPQLVLEGYNFYIRADVLMFESPLPEPEASVTKPEMPGVFSLEQLGALVDLFLVVAPRGLLPERYFVYLLQDMAHDAPASWQGENLSAYYFGEAEVIDWRDFVVYNLCLPFPTEEELMETRRQFREHDVDSNECVYDYQYYDVRFWFDNKEPLRGRKCKELLYQIYKTNDGTVNYPALLLAFCKDKDPVLGLTKALELALGNYICWQGDLGEAFKSNLRKRRKLEEQEQALDVINYLLAFDDGIEFKTLSATYQEQCPRESGKSYQVTFEGGKPRLLLDGLQTEFMSDCTFQKIYFLPFEAVLCVLMAAVQNMADTGLRQKIEVAYETCRNSEFDQQVFAHEFLHSKLVLELLEQVCKFTAKHPSEL